MNAKTRRHAPIALLILASALALTGCAAASSSAPSAPASHTSSAAPAAATSAAPAPSPTPSATEVTCTTHACIVSDLESNLTGLIAQDEAVATKVTCYKSTVVFHAAADTYSASCTVTYSDGSSESGTGNLDLSQQKVTFDPAN